MTNKEASEVLKASSIQQMSFCKVVVNGKEFNVKEALNMAIKSLEAWEKIDDDIASLQDIYSIGGSETEKAIWENLQAVRKTIHEYLKEVSE